MLCGDVPLIRTQTIADLVSIHRDQMADLTVLAAKVDDPTGYGRVIQGEDGGLLAIREEADAKDSEKQINIVNSGIFVLINDFLNLV